MTLAIPFDKRKALFWGRFIRAAEVMYSSGINNPLPPSPFPPKWTHTTNITMEASLDFLQHREFIGFIAKSQTNPAEQVVALHGSQTLLDWIDDFEFSLTNFPLLTSSGKTEYGFTQLYSSFVFTDVVTGKIQTLEEYLQGLTSDTVFTIAGHSLGGALANLHAVMVAHAGCRVTPYTFAAPMVGNHEFVSTFQAAVDNSYTIINRPDIVPQLPGTLLGYETLPTSVYINSLEHSNIRRCLICYHALATYLYTLGCDTCQLGSCTRDPAPA